MIENTKSQFFSTFFFKKNKKLSCHFLEILPVKNKAGEEPWKPQQTLMSFQQGQSFKESKLNLTIINKPSNGEGVPKQVLSF
jgi:5-methylcytosine-specific restriction endonuclease McrBC GTP-binding regulatory subunit McrB